MERFLRLECLEHAAIHDFGDRDADGNVTTVGGRVATTPRLLLSEQIFALVVRMCRACANDGNHEAQKPDPHDLVGPTSLRFTGANRDAEKYRTRDAVTQRF